MKQAGSPPTRGIPSPTPQTMNATVSHIWPEFQEHNIWGASDNVIEWGPAIPIG